MRAIRYFCLAASFVGLVACGSSQETPGTSGGASSGSSGSGAAQDDKEAAPSVRTASEADRPLRLDPGPPRSSRRSGSSRGPQEA